MTKIALTRLAGAIALTALFLLPLTIATPATADDAVPTLEEQLADVEAAVETPEVLPADEVIPSLEEQLKPTPATIWCPFGAPFCSNDDQCDDYCGDPRFGACEGFCCACLG